MAVVKCVEDIYGGSKKIRKPKMVLFDYGNTLVYEPEFSKIKGIEAVLQYAVKNKNGLTAEQICLAAQELCTKLKREVGTIGIEIHRYIFQRLLFAQLGLSFSLSHSQIELIFWDHASAGEPMPHIDQVFAYLSTYAIPSGVISNLAYSSEALKARVDRIIPNHNLSFFLTSSEYLFRKPSPVMFEAAIKQTGFLAQDIWYCGDQAEADICGAFRVGLQPVWYQSSLPCDYYNAGLEALPDANYLYITDWLELIELFETCTL